MRLSSFAAFAGISACVIAQPHDHRHRHRHAHSPHAIVKRIPDGPGSDPPGPVETVVVYVLNGVQISEQDVQNGLANGTLVWGDDGNLSSSSAVPTPTPVPIMETPSQQPAPPPSSQISLAPLSSVQVLQAQPTSSPQQQSSEQGAPQPSATPSQSSNQNAGSGTPDGVDREFPNDQFDCSSFPQGYGAVTVDHAGLGGWIGIQSAQVAGAAGYDDITTTPAGSCQGDNCCTPGAFCSYSCPPAYLKASWPKSQGAKGQSVGGLECTAAGKLRMASGSIAKTLCVKGTDKVTIQVQNKLSSPDSICRTDYPGTESETIPITTQPGATSEIACPDAATYYTWTGDKTSAQYYINNQNVSESDACQWGDGSRPVGNWAPINLGVGYDSSPGIDMGYISLIPNKPTTDAPLDFNVEFVSDKMDGTCKYTGGQFYRNGQVDTTGCTVALHPGGTLTVVLSD